ncbi:MAG: hypothetical protein ACI9BK_002615, partial [Acidimicrobiales bacterium]
ASMNQVAAVSEPSVISAWFHSKVSDQTLEPALVARRD